MCSRTIIASPLRGPMRCAIFRFIYEERKRGARGRIQPLRFGHLCSAQCLYLYIKREGGEEGERGRLQPLRFGHLCGAQCLDSFMKREGGGRERREGTAIVSPRVEGEGLTLTLSILGRYAVRNMHVCVYILIEREREG